MGIKLSRRQSARQPELFMTENTDRHSYAPKMAPTLHEVLLKALEKLEDSSFQRFIENLIVWEVREEYKNIPKHWNTGAGLDHVAGQIVDYFRSAYGAEVTLAILEDINEKKVRQELQDDLKNVDMRKFGLGTMMFTDRVNFIDNHRPDLERIVHVDPVLYDLRIRDLLTREQYYDLTRRPTTQEKVRGLCDITRHWKDDRKYMAYTAFRKCNEEIIKDLELSWKKIGRPKSPNEDHFIDRHRSHLIENIENIDQVINDLQSNQLLSHKLHRFLQRLSTTRRKMMHLCEIFSYRDYTMKDQFYVSLWRYNYTVISDLETSDRRRKYPSEESGASQSPTQMIQEDRSGTCCDTVHDNSVQLITPSMTGSIYHLSLTSPGLFRCSQSGIQFRVTQPVTIEYEVESWSNYSEILQTLHGGYEIIGPLFNIKSRLQPNIVATVYLPHCLCIEGFTGDKSLIRCFHYKDDNVVLEAPSRTEAMYAVLDNPSFSCIGVILYPLTLLKEELIKLIPYHGMVLLFCNTIARDDLIQRFILHLYLLPRIRTMEKQVEISEMRFSFQRISKPPQTESLYFKKKYKIHGPMAARVFPKMLLFESHCPSEIFAYTEISMEGERNTEVDVSICPENCNDTVWETSVSGAEMLDLSSAISKPTVHSGACASVPERSVHFVDEHRADLIRMISVVGPVLDDFLGLKLLTYEQYQTVRSQNTNQEQMRRLYDYIRAWGHEDKDKVYQSLRNHNRPIIRKLESGDPVDCDEPRTSRNNYRCKLF
ncbi:uncharacterized protein [Engystomops pustulosus]|uniref:uncharacterized protein n=1 Tax=Engystomops pustulosus TaxID=76066 RepID=UPI003AFAC9D9